jgi:hypothetical protein
MRRGVWGVRPCRKSALARRPALLSAQPTSPGVPSFASPMLRRTGWPLPPSLGSYGGTSRRHTAVSRTRTFPSQKEEGRMQKKNEPRLTSLMCKGSAKERGHEVKNTTTWCGYDWEGASCSEKLNVCRKCLIFRELSPFCRVFHSFFTPCFRRNGLIVRYLGKTHRHKRRKQFKYKVRNAKFEDKERRELHELPRIFFREERQETSKVQSPESKVGNIVAANET